MRRIRAVVLKEIKDNLRDRRALFFALIYGPVILPLMIIGPMLIGVKLNSIDFDKVTTIAVIGADKAPNFIQFLHENNIEVTPAPQNYREEITENKLKLVLEIDDIFAEQFTKAEPALLTLYFNGGDSDSQNSARQLRVIVNRYDRLIGKLRMAARGFDADVLDVINLVEDDLSAEGEFGTKMISHMLPFVLVFAMTMGGFYLAIDSIPGERERNSLEPLLSLPLPRAQLLVAKALAVLVFVLFSGFLASLTFFLVVSLAPVEKIDEIFDYRFIEIIYAYILAMPLGVFMTSILILVSIFSRSTKEAQTHLGIMMIVPMMPLFALEFLNVKVSSLLMAAPIVGQYLLLGSIATGDMLTSSQIIVSVCSTLMFSIVVFVIALLVYRRERLVA